MKNKGFTLVELLAVVIILTLLIGFVMPQITNSVNNYRQKTDEITTKLVIDATKLYIKDNIDNYPKKNNNTYCITLNELIENEYLKNSIKLNNMDVTNLKSVKAFYNNNKFSYDLVNSSECISYKQVCEAVTEDTVTTGNIPTGEFNNGDEYICEVRPGENYHFFVLSKEGNKINLIMNRNICNDGTVATETNTCTVAYNLSGDAIGVGPVTAIEYLEEATNTWVNIPNMNITYDDEGGNFTEFNISGKARLPYLNEVSNYDSTNKTNDYLYDYLIGGEIQENPINGISGYWTFSTSSPTNANILLFSGNIINNGIKSDSTFGVRPVIQIADDSIVNPILLESNE